MTTGMLSKAGTDGQALYFVNPSLVLGSAAVCDVVLKQAAPQHCRIAVTPAGYEFRDLTGQGLVRVNGTPMAKGILKDGDVIAIGKETLTFALEELVEGLADNSVSLAPDAGDEKIGRSSSRQAAPRRLRRMVSPPATGGEEKKLITRRVAFVIGGGVAVMILLLVIILVPGSRSKEEKVTKPSEVASKGTAGTSKAVRASSEAKERPQSDRLPLPSSATSEREGIPGAKETPSGGSLPVPESTPPLGVSFLSPGPVDPVPSRNPLRDLEAILRDPSLRPSKGEMRSLGETLRTLPRDSEVARVFARVLFYSGSFPVPGGTDGIAWSAYVREVDFGKLDSFSPAQHQAAALLLKDGSRASSFLRSLELAHLLDALPGDPSTEKMLLQAGFREAPGAKLWGEPEAIFQYQVARYFVEHRKDDPRLEASALSSIRFGTHYAGILIEVERSLARGSGLQYTFNDLTSMVAPTDLPGGASHFRALAESFRKAVYCKDCKGGRVSCPQCQGKARVDLPCAVCKGLGRVSAPGAVDGAAVTQKCRNCEGAKIFRQVGCPTCAKSGSVLCTSCGGSPWREAGCTNPACRGGWLRCETCHGGGKVDVPCPDCGGTGRVMAPGAALNVKVTQKCRTCNEDHGIIKKGGRCASCAGAGLIRCPTCQGKQADPRQAVCPISEIWTPESCNACKGTGWPSSRAAIPCDLCQGLGIRIRPATDPSKCLE